MWWVYAVIWIPVVLIAVLSFSFGMAVEREDWIRRLMMEEHED